ncbi:MAG: polyphosphate polymerase domain-containing protein [Erysipelotrichaceae bacterium]|nr:polyphosphate polymerase domain-containing protein [Erysipelotrichaceae bacterium]
MVKDIEYRYELKFVISQSTAELLKKQLRNVMYLDSHSVSEEYSYDIRSIYFDDIYASAYREKVNGEEYRAKYRIRMYNNDPNAISLECKHKDENMTYKESCRISREVTEALLNRQYVRINSKNSFMNRFLADAISRNLVPSVIVDYRRLAFTYPVSEVRITFDEDLHSGRYSTDFFNKDINTIAMYPEGVCVMEVKCNEYIPQHILAILNSVPKLRQAVSKFAICRSIK